MTRKEAEKPRSIYDSIGTVHCEHLDIDVIFNAKGFHHLYYEGDGTPRNRAEVQYRLKLLPWITHVIRQAKEYIYEERKARVSSKKKAPIKLIKYWALMAWVGENNHIKIKVIIRQVGNGQVHFWSVMRLKVRNKKHQLKSWCILMCLASV